MASANHIGPASTSFCFYYTYYFSCDLFPVVPTLSLSSTAYNVSESGGSVRVCVFLNTPLTFVLDLFITTTDGTATEGKRDADFIASKQI